ncbi:MAG: hypothetical protein MJ066_06540, partial [Clostridia bacterium]|nr:hypothetical protein [Clostridia bacterium]
MCVNATDEDHGIQYRTMYRETTTQYCCGFGRPLDIDSPVRYSRMSKDELLVFKRARNTKKASKAKSASVAEYNASTGFEAVFGFLYLTNDIDRINFLINKVNEDEN